MGQQTAQAKEVYWTLNLRTLENLPISYLYLTEDSLSYKQQK